MDAPTNSSKKERGTTDRTSSVRRESSSSSSRRQATVQQQQQQRQGNKHGSSGRSARPETSYRSVEPLSARRGLHNCGLERGPDPDNLSNSYAFLRGSSGEIPSTSGGQRVQHGREERDGTATTGRRIGKNGNNKMAAPDHEEYERGSFGCNKYYAGISRRDIIERRSVGLGGSNKNSHNNDHRHHQDENAIERFAQTLRNRWSRRTIVASSGGSRARDYAEKFADNNTQMPEPYLEERPRTLPSVVKKSRDRYVDRFYANEALPDVLLPEGRRISRQDILNRRASSFGANNSSSGLIRRKSSGALEIAGLSLSVNSLAKDERGKGDESVRRNSGYVKNTSGIQQRSGQREQLTNAGRKRRDASMERNRAGGSRSVADFLTVPTHLRDMTRGLVPRPSTLPKIVHTTRSSRPEPEWIGIGRTQRDFFASREAPIYGRIRRRKLSLPTNSRESQLRKSTGSLARLARKSDFHNDNELDVIIVEKEPKTEERHDFSNRRRKETSQLEGKSDIKKNPLYGRFLGSNTSSSRSSFQTTGGARSREVKDNERIGSVLNDRNSSRRIIVVPNPRELPQVSRRRIIENVGIPDTTVSQIPPRSSSRLQGRSIREIDYATIDRAIAERSRGARGREESMKSKKSHDVVEIDKHNGKSHSAEDRGKSEDPKSKEIRSKSFRATHASSTLPLYSRGLRKSSSSTSSSIPVKIGTRNSPETRQTSTNPSDIKNPRGTTKSIKDRTNYVKKSVAAHVKSFGQANDLESNSPVPSSSIFGFCTGRRRVKRQEQDKKNDREERSSSRTVRFFI